MMSTNLKTIKKLLQTTLFLTLLLFTLSAKAEKWRLGPYVGAGISNIDYPGNGENPSWVFAYEVGGALEKQISNYTGLGTALRFQKTGYLQKGAQYIDGVIPVDGGINDYRLTVPIEIYLSPAKHSPVSLLLGLENSFKLKRDKVLKPHVADDKFGLGSPSNYNINLEVGLRGDITRSLTIGLVYRRGLNAVFRHVDGFNLNMFTLNLSWWVYKF